MTINVYTIVWNEEFMLPHFLKHYSQFADRIFVIDDHSTDLTAEIAKAHPLVTYSEYDFEGLKEDEFNDTFESYYENYKSDWAVVVDCDEFIQDLGTVENEPSGVFKTNGYMMIGSTGKLEDCKPVRMKTFDKPVVFTPNLGVKFGDGRHTVNLPVRESKMDLLHYKYPSRDYYIKRNTEGYARFMSPELADKMLKKGLRWFDDHIS